LKKVGKAAGKGVGIGAKIAFDLFFDWGNTSLGNEKDTISYSTFYHKGNLDRPNKPYLSTGTNRQTVEALARDGDVHTFLVPTTQVIAWERELLVTRLRDLDLATGVINEEVRFSGRAKVEILKFEIPTRK
jgi:hypothetical protein